MSYSTRAIRNQLKTLRETRKENNIKSPKSNRIPKYGFGVKKNAELKGISYSIKVNKSKGLNKDGKPLARIAKKPRM